MSIRKSVSALFICGLIVFGAAPPAKSQPHTGLRPERNVHVVADETLAGTNGNSGMRERFLVQSVVFSRTVRIATGVRAQWTFLDTETIPAGAILYGLGNKYCTQRSACLEDTDGDGFFDTSFPQFGTNTIDLFNFYVESRHWPLEPTAFEVVPAPEELRHEIGIALTSYRRSRGDRPAEATFTTQVRRADNRTWMNIRGLEQTITLDGDGRGVVEILGAEIRVQFSEDRRFQWVIERPIPEQPIHAYLSSP